MSRYSRVRRKRLWQLLFVDTGNQERSGAAEAFCQAMVRSHGLNIQVASACVMPGVGGCLTSTMIENADAVLAMDPYVVSTLVSEYGVEPSRIICLYIPNIYDRNDPELQVTLEAKLRLYLLALDWASCEQGERDATDTTRMSGGMARAS